MGSQGRKQPAKGASGLHFPPVYFVPGSFRPNGSSNFL